MTEEYRVKRSYSVIVKSEFLIDQPLFLCMGFWVENIEQATKFSSEAEAEQFKDGLVCTPEEYLTVWSVAEEA